MPGFPFTAVLPTALVFASPALAQTYVVDVNVGPGFDYQQIRGAALHAPDGATLIVRPGVYAPFTIDGKGLTILADPGVTVAHNPLASDTEIRNTGPAQRTVLRGLAFERQLVVRNCDGPVLLEDATFLPGGLFNAYTAHLHVNLCDQVFVRGIDNGGTTLVGTSTVVFEDCVLHGLNAYSQGGDQGPGSPGLACYQSDVTLVDCDVNGGSGVVLPTNQMLEAAPAISAIGGRFALLGATVATAGGGNGIATVPVLGVQYVPAPTVPVRIDPQVQLATAHPTVADPEFQLTTRPLPHVTGQSAAVGATLTASAPGPIGQFVILVVGLPGAPIVLPGIDNAFWLDPVVSAWAAVGVPQTGAPLTGSATIPNSPSFRG
ncbi:MAG: hypothetical protein KDE27_32640, partial [Planctomycetes bacterium]|nr:hypothetical protein [Planctomycetota bacterium]